jgi:lysophospholipase L1-like esterase
MIFEKSDKLVMIGDSITDCGRKQPVGEGLGDGLGNGYIAIVDALLSTVYPEQSPRLVNMGISGNTVRDLKNRWKRDVLELKPDWLSIMIGINDVWRQYDQPLIRESHVYLDEYESTLTELVTKTRPLVKGLILMTPYYIEPNQKDDMRATMDEYGSVVKRIAENNNAIFIDTQAAIDHALKYSYPAALSWDRVHPNMTGHAILARAFLNGAGFAWNKK